MTDRGLPIVDGAPACPFVAFEDDRDGRGTAPDHRHRCYAEPRPAPRALAHQEAYCLSSAFPVCPTFQDWARREAATTRAVAAEPEDPPREEVPVSQALPPRELEARHAAGTETPPPLPPRRNPPRDWAAPPPWSGDEDGEGELDGRAGPAPVDPPPFLASRDADRAAEAAAWGAASRGLAGSAADRLAGPYDGPYEDGPYADPRPADRGPRPTRPPPADRDAPATLRARRAEPRRRARAGRRGRPADATGSRSAQPAPAQHREPPQDAAELFGPAWERPRRYEAYPSLRTRVGLPGLGAPPRIAVAAIAVVLAAIVLFFVGPMLLGIGGNQPGGGAGATARPSAEASASPEPTLRPAPTAQVYVVAKGDTISKIARRFGLTVDQLLAANKQIKNPNRITIGDEIKIPAPEPDAGSAAP